MVKYSVNSVAPTCQVLIISLVSTLLKVNCFYWFTCCGKDIRITMSENAVLKRLEDMFRDIKLAQQENHILEHHVKIVETKHCDMHGKENGCNSRRSSTSSSTGRRESVDSRRSSVDSRRGSIPGLNDKRDSLGSSNSRRNSLAVPGRRSSLSLSPSRKDSLTVPSLRKDSSGSLGSRRFSAFSTDSLDIRRDSWDYGRRNSSGSSGGGFEDIIIEENDRKVTKYVIYNVTTSFAENFFFIVRVTFSIHA